MAKTVDSKEKSTSILVVCQHYWPENFRVNDLCDYFVENNFKIDVLCGIPNYPKGKFYPGYNLFRGRTESHKGINIKRVLEIPRGNNSNLRIFLNYISFPFFSLFHLPKLLTKKYDKIFIYQLSPVFMAITGIILGKLKKIETTMYVLDLWPENLYSVINVKNNFLRKMLTRISRWHYRNVDKIVVLSKKMKQIMLEITQLSEKDILIVPQGTEKIYEAKVKDNGLIKKYKGGLNLVYTGNISPAQSYKTMVEAAKIVRSRGVNARWIIIGDGMSKKDFQKQVNEQGLKAIFSFEGQKPITAIPKYFYIADALIGCLAKSELLEATIPAKITSYFAAKKPVIVAMDGEVREIINNIECGYATKTEDSKALAESIVKLYNANASQRALMGKKAFDYYRDNFERGVTYSKIRDFIGN